MNLLGVIVDQSTVLTLIALVGLAAAAFVVARRRETVADLGRALEAAEGAATAWKEERDAAVSKADRLTDQVDKLETRLREAESTISRLQERTDLTKYFEDQRSFFETVTANQADQTDAIKSLSTSVEVLAVNLKPLLAAH